jgi:pSer/pThr/pTyr-binding forkhead associated (FHA) protein
MDVKLVVANGKQAGKAIPIAGPKFLIGRGEGCQLRPQSTEVSRKHCAILIEAGSASIEDCGSTNGTFLNDQRITGRQELKSGDRIRVGMLGLDVRLSAAVGGEKKPQVRTVQEAAARTIAAVPAGGNQLDISGWLGNGSTPDMAPANEQPAAVNDTLAGKSLIDTATMPAPPPKKEAEKQAERKEEAKKKETPAKGVGKLRPPPAQTSARDSGTAADNALRQFFFRKKP